MDTGKRYRSRVDHHYGKAFVRGYEYMARLQYLPHNIKLCPVEGTQEWNLTVVPPDKLPGIYILFFACFCFGIERFLPDTVSFESAWMV